MIEIGARLDELKALGLRRRTRLVSGPQGPHVLLDGKPVLLLCSNNYLGLADHPRVREAAAEAAMRWGVGAGASRLVSGTMTIHRRLEERLAAFKGREAALLFGSGYLAIHQAHRQPRRRACCRPYARPGPVPARPGRARPVPRSLTSHCTHASDTTNLVISGHSMSARRASNCCGKSRSWMSSSSIAAAPAWAGPMAWRATDSAIRSAPAAA